MQRISLMAAVCLTMLAGLVQAETTVELKKTHMCCGACVKAANKVLETAGVKGEASQEDSSIRFTAADEKAAQKVLDDLAAAGFHGETGSATLKSPNNSGAPDGKVTSLTLKGIHNCCGQCNTKIKATLKKVQGVESDDLKVRETTFTVTGNFDAKALVKALNEAGFHATVEKK
jgi:copper chaperone CopZ